eukprot:gnl/TRDRNA2_/TRDRNA2_133877_c1_seq2.p1 gnl/TRDRNA2_/TRDRNA2_133877_c1~~gnl/TRDRNA2_/TRDRNA2_133877_c1_seq2.p1  ORF type:complete len:155 (+),score=16.98 gnl/TRDRNA2_/TRDRNA2_133877_c1_seq2:24-488(+)
MSRRLVSRRQKKGFSGDGSKKQERQRREKLEAASLRDQPVAFEKILNDTPEEVSVWWQLPGGRQPAGGKFHQSLTPDKLSMQKKCVPSSTHEVCVNFRDPSLSRAITTCLQVLFIECQTFAREGSASLRLPVALPSFLTCRCELELGMSQIWCC